MGGLFAKVLSFLPSWAVPNYRVLINGLDAAGKTTIVYYLKLGQKVVTIPTIGFNVETIQVNRMLSFTMWDVGGGEKLRPLFRHYTEGTRAFIYVVDGSDVERLPIAIQELYQDILSHDTHNLPLLIFLNKYDLPGIASCEYVAEAANLLNEKQRRWRVQASIATTGAGLQQGLEWLSRQVLESKSPSDLFHDFSRSDSLPFVSSSSLGLESSHSSSGPSSSAASPGSPIGQETLSTDSKEVEPAVDVAPNG